MTTTNHLKSEDEVNQLFTRVAPHYDKLNNVISLGTQKCWRKKLLAGLEFRPGIKALDICCGTGDLTIAMAKRLPQGRVTGVDFNTAMLKIAKRKAKTIPNLILINGDAMNLPLDDDSFDIVTIGFGLRNVPDADKALTEIYRVLKPGGQLGVLEMSQPTNPFIKLGWKMYFKTFPYLAKLAGGKVTDYQYLQQTSQQFVSAKQLAKMIENTGFKFVTYTPLNFGAAALHFGIKE
ncbi:bifunctional demethylmenaquinone methyltransferase/2-methoxy-6-polyprenyl-1,4-benzoquinol methylase UbiE [Limosilactobacillus fastidiosus]|uniref:Demethylmenaquinone methyltransferase n=1 Tax=Limosilactobacillus fastidiosus TaxID=2759855 RepID=A0A7W3YC01_9LACO|nr:bifunctional demethylmenaquinone methyltransferase/2-methoxy-6-polyprenyl-1,4-benzoquinol methylase UbiE [Limosilactobacillus fastidiosus]MBB1063786.1 bifunctional demethylmenaquinone methyltransferase/2-methoxy-6-polyprenyl-1,4-benzoquinol methylase UbiE [Limosilactobacillus fastidiosus]MBB1086249.1 bifunctional demethylmenaquinone methyltransferase/2-methoxy-6-polyprenyl-1,4-benzoquinol methylase UbiE [Limosilactobacillus fastidiosus]MCD7084361.1 bifunctional demethylmenaquinone methyltrans